jgi:hypothetical protein
MEFFLNSDHCPNFVKAGVEKAKIHVDDELINNEDENDRFNSSVFDNSNQPEWMELVHPNKQFEEIDSDFSFDNGGQILIGVKPRMNIQMTLVRNGLKTCSPI